MFARMSRWPTLQLTSVPALDGAEDAAAAVREAVLPPGRARHAPVDDLAALCRAGSIILRRRALSGRTGGVQALLAPRSGGRFFLAVDPTPAGGWGAPDGLRAAVARQRERFLIA